MHMGHRAARCTLERLHHFQHARAAPGAEIDRREARMRLGVGDAGQMAERKIDHVQIVAHARAIGASASRRPRR